MFTTDQKIKTVNFLLGQRPQFPCSVVTNSGQYLLAWVQSETKRKLSKTIKTSNKSSCITCRSARNFCYLSTAPHDIQMIFITFIFCCNYKCTGITFFTTQLTLTLHTTHFSENFNIPFLKKIVVFCFPFSINVYD